MSAPIALIKLYKTLDCVIIGRLTRFTVLAEIGGLKEVVYTNNTGRLRQYIIHGKVGICSEIARGKLRYRLIGVYDEEGIALIDTAYQEKSFLVAQELGLIPWLRDCTLIKRNYGTNGVLIDFAFKCKDILTLVEVKSAVLKLHDGSAGYPDAPTVRGRLQLLELSRFTSSGGRAYVVFIAAVPGARKFKLYCEEDKYIKQVVDVATKSGVVFKSVKIFVEPEQKTIVLGDPDLPVELTC